MLVHSFKNIYCVSSVCQAPGEFISEQNVSRELQFWWCFGCWFISTPPPLVWLSRFWIQSGSLHFLSGFWFLPTEVLELLPQRLLKSVNWSLISCSVIFACWVKIKGWKYLRGITFSHFEWETRLPLGSDELLRPFLLPGYGRRARYFCRAQEEGFLCLWKSGLGSDVLGLRGQRQ